MPRKENKKITEELKEIIISLSQDRNTTIKKIASEVKLNRNAVSRIIRGLPTSGSNTDTVQNELNVRTTQKDQVIRNIITTQNDLTQQ
jgi:transposase-like protein